MPIQFIEGLPTVAYDNTEDILKTKLTKTISSVFTLHNATNSTGNGTMFDVEGFGVCTLQITGTFTASIVFQGSVDGTNFVAIPAIKRDEGNTVYSTTSIGLYEINCRGLKGVRAVVTWTSGTSVTIIGRAEPFAGSNTSMQLTGSTEVETIVNNQTIATGLTGTGTIAVQGKGATEMWLLININKQPWDALVDSPWEASILSTSLFPVRSGVVSTFTSTASPARSLIVLPSPEDALSNTDLNIAKAQKRTGSFNFRVRQSSGEDAVVTVRVLRMWV